MGKANVLAAFKEDLVPIIIVAVLLFVYAQQIMTGGNPPDDLRTLVATVVAFYFAGKQAERANNGTAARIQESAASIQQTASAIASNTNSGR